jgi:hypothetical protein
MNPLTCEEGCECNAPPIMLCRNKVKAFNDESHLFSNFISCIRLLSLVEDDVVDDWGALIQDIVGREIKRRWEEEYADRTQL